MDDADLIILSSDEEICTTGPSKDDKRLNSTAITGNSIKTELNDNQQNAKPTLCNTNILNPNLKTELSENIPNQCSSSFLKNYLKGSSSVETSKQTLVKNAKERTSITHVNLIEDNRNGREIGTEIYKKFLAKALSMEHKTEDKAKLEKKLTKYYKLADEEYVVSSEFQILLEKCLAKLEKEPLALYFVVKEVLDCLLSKRVLFGSTKNYEDPKEGCSNHKSEEESNDNLYFEADDKNIKVVKKLTRLLEKLEKRIKQLEEMEVDLSDEEDSTYVKLQRYRERFCKVYEKLCSYTSQSSSAKRLLLYKKIDFSGLSDPRLNQAIQKWLNKTKQFPDFFDVHKHLKELNESLSLGLSKEGVRTMATDIFMQIGNALQRRRKYDLWDSFSPFLENEIDPATTDVDLRLSLEKNFEIGVKKERELINYYAEKQDKDNLNPQEVPDEEANRSPVESGDEDEKEIEEVENTLYSHTEIENSEESEEEIYNQEKNSESHPERSADKENSDTKDSSSNVADEDEIVGSEGSTNNGMEVAEEINDENDIERFHLNETEKAVKVGSPRADSWFVVSEIRSVPLMSADAREVRNKTNNKSFHLKPWSDSDSDMSVKKRKLEETTIDSDSDCEVVIIPSDDDECDCTTKNSTNRKIHHVNYAFINSNFNHIAFSRGDNPWCKRNFRGWHRNIKKNPRRYTYPLPFRDLTNIKSITEKFARVQEEDSNRWTMKRSVVKRARLTLKRANTFFLSKSSVHCALQSNTSAKNINSASNGDRSNEKGAVEQSSGDETMDSSTGGGLGGGNGQDNNDNNDNKKPFDHENELEDNQENDDQDEGENGEEGNDRSKLGAEQEEKGASVEENAGDVNDSCVTEEGEKEDVTSRGEDQEWEKERSPVEDAEEENNPAAEEDCQEENNASVEQNDEKPTETSEEECAGKDVSAAEEGERDSEMYKENEETNVTTTEADKEEKPEESKPEGMEESSLKPESEDVEEKSDTTKTDKADGDDTGDVPFIISEKIKAKTETNPKPKTPSKPRLQNRPSPRTKKESPAKSMRHQLGSPRRQRQVSYENYDTFSIAPGNWENFKAVKRRLYPGIPSSNSAGMAYENRISQASPSKTQKSDEEIVKNFLQHSPSSISITRTKKATAQNKPSPSVLQALETLSRLKGISTTIVKGTSKRKTDEDVTVISETLTKAANSPSKFNKSTGSFSNVQSDDCTMPRIVTVQGNVSGFESIRSNHPGSHQSKPYNRRRSSQDSNVTYGRSTISRNLAPNVHNGNTQSCPRPRGGAAGMRPRHTAPARQQKSVEYVELD